MLNRKHEKQVLKNQLDIEFKMLKSEINSALKTLKSIENTINLLNDEVMEKNEKETIKY